MKIILPLWFTFLHFFLIASQCNYSPVYIDSFEGSDPIPGIIQGAVFQTIPQTYSGCVHSGSKGMYLNFMDGFTGLAYRQKIDNLCVGSTYTISFWVREVWSGFNNCVYQILDANNSNIVSQTIQNGNTWTQIQLGPFTASSESVFFEIHNLETTGSNDLGFDDLTLEKCLNSSTVSGCEGSEITLIIPSSGIQPTPIYNWSINNIVIPGTNTLDFQQLAFNSSDTIEVRLNDNPETCIYAQVVLTVYAKPTVNAGNNQTICEGDSISLNGFGTGNLSWNNNVANNQLISPPVGSMDYILTALSAEGCMNKDTLSITVNSKPDLPIVIAEEDFCIGKNVTLFVQNPSETVVWFSNNGFAVTDTLSTLVQDGAQSFVIMQSQNGCESDSVLFQIDGNYCNLIIPSAITPDDDFVNDQWKLIGLDAIHPANTVQIFNRWGNLVFESQPGKYSEQPWDGNYQGKPLPVGSYYYLVHTNNSNGDILKGTVSIIRN